MKSDGALQPRCAWVIFSQDSISDRSAAMAVLRWSLSNRRIVTRSQAVSWLTRFAATLQNLSAVLVSRRLPISDRAWATMSG